MTPTPEQLASWQFFLVLILAIVAAFAACAWILDRGIDGALAYWNHVRTQTIVIRFVFPFQGQWTLRRELRSNVVDFSERRRLNAIVALRETR